MPMYRAGKKQGVLPVIQKSNRRGKRLNLKTIIAQFEFSEWMQISQIVILAITAYIVWLYTWETKKLRVEASKQVEETKKQTDQMIQPFLFLFLKGEAEMGISVTNISNNPALSVYLEPFYFNDRKELKATMLKDKPIPLVRPEASRDLKFEAINEQGIKEPLPAITTDFFRMDHKASVNLVFYNSSGTRFRLTGYFQKSQYYVSRIVKG